MDVIAHQNIGMDLAVVGVCRFLEPSKISMIIIRFRKNGFATVTPYHHMHRYARQKKARLAWHVKNLCSE